ncbi:kinesin-associated protein 3 isoform X4 [Aethina tumida]|uniref:kinesin-associated protein 3 isoform X4 n=1 Tax=Aethina tumida TaxID=116153 RepID=UPI0021481133|nr:kinesin-associated protein 3 isoform X4 [Aethina tumida]
MIVIFNVFLVVFAVIFLAVSYVVYSICFVLYYQLESIAMEPDEAKYLRTERKPGSIDVHPSLEAIVLNYEIDVQILGNKDTSIYGEKQSLKKIIELPMLNSRTDCHALAKEVVNQCDLIHHSRLAEVEQIIYYLKKRKLHGGLKTEVVTPKSGKITPRSAHKPPKIPEVSHSKTEVVDKNGNIAKASKIPEIDTNEKTQFNPSEANYNNLSNYIDLLYEGMDEKVKGAHLIQFLARDPENLEALAKYETLISALGRTLREDWKRSIALSTHLVFTFFCFSMYPRFHDVILKCKVGSICMDIIDFELRRYDRWKAELEGSQIPNDVPIISRPCPSSASMSEIPRSRIPEKVRPKSGNFTDTNMKAVMEGSIYDDLTNSTDSLDDKKLTTEQRTKRFRTLVKKQEHLLRVAFYLLLNIAEDESVEEKMSKRNIVGLLVKALERSNEDLLILVVTFLKKLSIMQCNKDAMANLNIVDKLPKNLDSNNPDLVHLTVKLLFNLSFDYKLRLKVAKAGLLPKIIGLLSDEKHQEAVLKLLYHLSYDDEIKPHFLDCVGLITDMLLLNSGSDNDKIMVALLINLAINPTCAQQMIKKNRLQSLMMRAFTYQDPMLMKMLHNVSEHSNCSPSFIEFVGDIAKAVVDSKEEDFVRECIGILSNLHLPDLDWAEIFRHFDMIKWIKNVIRSNNADPELVLQVVVLLGTAASDEGCAKLLCQTDIMTCLIELLKTHQEDDEIVLQIVYVFLVNLSHDENIDYLVEQTEAPAYLIDLLQDNNKSIRKICNTCLNIISNHSTTWSDRIRIEKFRNHNSQWLQMVDNQQLDPDEEEEDGELPPYLNTEYLSTAVVPPLNESTVQTAAEMIRGLVVSAGVTEMNTSGSSRPAVSYGLTVSDEDDSWSVCSDDNISNNDGSHESEIISERELDYDYFDTNNIDNNLDNDIIQDFEIEAM